MKEIIQSPNRKWSVVTKKVAGGPSYSELQFYHTGSGLRNVQFVLNEDDTDGISLYDIAFSEDDKTVYLSFQFSGGRSRNIESYFGSYDLDTKQLFQAPFRLTWSLNPYYMA